MHRPALRPMLIGHRGAPCHRPEHSAAAYRLALEQGCDAVEPDVVPSRDGVLVVRHERRLDGSTDIAARPELADRRRASDPQGDGPGWYAEDLDWAELAALRCREPLPELRPASAAHDGEQPILRLRDLVALLDAAERRYRPSLVVEIKTPAAFAAQGFDMARLLMEELERIGPSSVLEGLVVESFEFPVLRELRWLGLPAKLVALVDDEREGPADPSPLGPEALDELASWADGVSPRHSLLEVAEAVDALDPAAGRALVDAAHERDLEVLTWTLRPEDRFNPPAFAGRPEDYWRGLLRTGVDGVFADAPDRVRPIVDEIAAERQSAAGAEARAEHPAGRGAR